MSRHSTIRRLALVGVVAVASMAVLFTGRGPADGAEALVAVQDLRREDGLRFKDWVEDRIRRDCSVDEVPDDEFEWETSVQSPYWGILVYAYGLNARCGIEPGIYGVASVDKQGKLGSTPFNSNAFHGSETWYDDFLRGEPAWPEPDDDPPAQLRATRDSPIMVRAANDARSLERQDGMRLDEWVAHRLLGDCAEMGSDRLDWYAELVEMPHFTVSFEVPPELEASCPERDLRAGEPYALVAISPPGHPYQLHHDPLHGHDASSWYDDFMAGMDP